MKITVLVKNQVRCQGGKNRMLCDPICVNFLRRGCMDPICVLFKETLVRDSETGYKRCISCIEAERRYLGSD